MRGFESIYWRSGIRQMALACAPPAVQLSPAQMRTLFVTAVLFVSVAHAGAAITVTVDANANRHSIDARIYGVAWADGATIKDLSIPLHRCVGDAMSRYNWSFS